MPEPIQQIPAIPPHKAMCKNELPIVRPMYTQNSVEC